MGRPSSYTDETAETICRLLADGLGLREICDREGMPAKGTVFRWLSERPSFQDRYARARELQAEHYADEIIEISDDATNDWMKRMQGEEVVDVINHDHIARSRLRVDARKWLMSKLAPKKYGDKIELGGNVEHSFVARIPEPAANATEWLASQAPKQLDLKAEPKKV